MKHALIIGNSDGIGLELTRSLLQEGYKVIGISKQVSPVDRRDYEHFVQDVTEPGYREILSKILSDHPELFLCVYCAGIGDQLRFDDLAFETRVFAVNLMSAAVTTEVVLGRMIQQNEGHFIGLSSIADGLTSAQSPSYNASKAGISRYWEGLALALAGKKVKITNIRFGFVDTKMAKSPFKPLMLSVPEAVNVIRKAIRKPRLRVTKPYAMAVLVWVIERVIQLKLLFS